MTRQRSHNCIPRKAAQAKIERDNSHIETLVEVEEKPYSRLVSFYESEKTKLLEGTTDRK